MKIPETPANVGAYYGNEENGQWQPNGVIIDGGVGGGVIGSGDAGVHRPSVYPVHIPRGHVPAGYVMAGAYYPPTPYPPVPAPAPDDFADYMWMENEEEFDKQVMQQLEEEALMEQCIEAMLEDEQRERNNRPQVANGHNHHYPTTSNGTPSLSLEETVSRSTLNPLAAEFVPTRVRLPPPSTENKQEPQTTEAKTKQEITQKTKEEEIIAQPLAEQKLETSIEVKAETTEENKTEEPVTPSKDPPEVSAADVQPIQENKQTDKKHRDVKRDMRPSKMDGTIIASGLVKKAAKTEQNVVNTSPKVVKMEVKAKKPVVVKSETKLTPKKKEVKVVKSEVRVEDKTEEVVLVPLVEPPKPLPPQSEEAIVPQNLPSLPPPSSTLGQVLSTPAPSGPKPINYAAAAKANKPKKPATIPATPVVEKTIQPVQKKIIEKKKLEKPPVQRKNSAK